MLNGVNILLEGPSGTGKTYAISTAVEWAKHHNSKVCVLFTENGLETLIGVWADRGQPVPQNLYWHSIQSNPFGFDQLKAAADRVARLSYKALTELVDAERYKNNTFFEILNVCSAFKDDRTGKSLGAINEWGTDTIFVIDGLTELSNAAMKMQIGSKPTAAPPDYGVAQSNVMNLLRLLTNGCRCHFILIGHVNRDRDEVTGSVKLMTKTVGSAISSEIPTLFSDVIFATREGDQFYWDTASSQVDTKTRNLPIRAKIKPDFGQIFDKWLQRSKAEGNLDAGKA